MTPHPNMSRRERAPRTSTSQIQNGVKSDVLGGGDPFGGKIMNGFHENGDFPQRTNQYPSLRGSRITVRPSISDSQVIDKVWGERDVNDLVGDSPGGQKRLSPVGSREALNGLIRPLAVVANGAEFQNGNSHQEK